MKEVFDSIIGKIGLVMKIVKAIYNKISLGDSQTQVLMVAGVVSNIFLFSSLLAFVIVLIVDFLIYLSIKSDI